MKHTVLFISALMLTGFSTAVVGHNGSGGDVQITGTGSSASATTAVGPNGTEYTSEVSMLNRTGQITNESLEDLSFGSGDKASVSFDGEITAGTPCHVIEHEVNDTGENSYVLGVKTVKDDLENQFCAQQLVMINYEGGFEKDEPFQLTVKHDGEELETLEHPDFEEETGSEAPKEEKESIFAGISRWLAGLF